MSSERLSFFFLPLSLILTWAQEVTPPETIRSIRLYNLQTKDYSAIIRLGDTLILEFDDMNGSYERYHYTLEHYTYDWKKSDIFSSEYMTQYEESNIRDCKPSFNTVTPYVHYRLEFPNEEVGLKRSGNYLLKIYTTDVENPTFTQRFVVVEPLTTISAQVQRGSSADMDQKQEVLFEITFNQLDLTYNLQDVHVSILKNNNWMESLSGLTPQFIQSKKLTYMTNAFEGGSPYRYFDTKNIRSVNLSVDHVGEDKNGFHTFLSKDIPRAADPYYAEPDLNGQFYIRDNDHVGENHATTEADYTMVHFTLEKPRSLDKEIYVVGAFNGWRLSEQNRMRYNETSGAYKCAILLKQGFYNYQYATQNKTGNIVSYTEIDGSYWQTENEYTILVYYKALDERHERVIGLGKINSETFFYGLGDNQ